MTTFWGQKAWDFQSQVSSKSQKSEKSPKWGPGSPKWAPGPLKYLKIMNLASQNQENPNAQRTGFYLTSGDYFNCASRICSIKGPRFRGLQVMAKSPRRVRILGSPAYGTVAGYARSALGYIYIYILGVRRNDVSVSFPFLLNRFFSVSFPFLYRFFTVSFPFLFPTFLFRFHRFFSVSFHKCDTQWYCNAHPSSFLLIFMLLLHCACFKPMPYSMWFARTWRGFVSIGSLTVSLPFPKRFFSVSVSVSLLVPPPVLFWFHQKKRNDKETITVFLCLPGTERKQWRKR